LAVDRHTAHDRVARQSGLDHGDLSRTEQFRRGAKVDDRGPQLSRPLDDQVRSRREKQGRKLRRGRYRSGDLRRPSERLFARKFAVADQDADVVIPISETARASFGLGIS
jgi:hypothetical protein